MTQEEIKMPVDANGKKVKVGDMVRGEGFITFHDGFKINRTPTVPVFLKDGIVYFGGLSAKSFNKFWIVNPQPHETKNSK